MNVSTTTTGRALTDAEKLRKVILELIETERTYVKVRDLFINIFRGGGGACSHGIVLCCCDST